MAIKSRKPMQVSPEFEIRIKNIQKEIMKKQGEKLSLRDLTERVVRSPNFDDIEKSIINIIDDTDLKLNLDVRRKK